LASLLQKTEKVGASWGLGAGSLASLPQRRFSRRNFLFAVEDYPPAYVQKVPQPTNNMRPDAMRLLLLALTALAIALGASAQSINWVQYINPTDRNDRAFGVCTFGDYLATYGRFFATLLDRATGEVVKTWRSEEYNDFYNCLSVGDRLYVVGEYKIYIFDRELNVVKRVETYWVPRAVTFDGSYLYLAGYLEKDMNGDGVDDGIWRIEKRTLDLDLVAYREFYKEWDRTYSYLSYANDIAINPATGELWVVGHWYLYNVTHHSDGSISASWIPDSLHSLIIIFDKELNIKKVVEYAPGHKNYLESLFGVCFDEEDNAFVVGYWGIAKFDKSGNLVAVSKKVWGYKVACVGGRVYAFGEKKVGDYLRHVLYVFDKELNLLGELVLSKGVEANSWFSIGRPAFDGRSLYVAGDDEALGKDNQRIVVYSISIPSMVHVVVQVVDGFGRMRSDWPVEMLNVTSGMGRVEAEVVEGLRYVARATGLGFTNTTAFTAKGPHMVVTIKIPTAKITAQVKDGFGNVRQDWPVEVVGVAAGRGTVEAEVLAGQYTVKAVAFGREFTQTVTLRAGEAQTVTVQVPTARLSVVVVDEGGALVRQVESVEVAGPTPLTFTAPPREVEVLAGQYTVRVRAFGREATAIATLSAGEVKTVKVVVPATQSQPTATQAASPTTPEAVTTPTATQTATMPLTESIQPATAPPPPTPPPPPTDFLLVGAAAAVLAIAGALAVARLRGRSAEVRKTRLTTQTASQPRVGEAGAVGDFCLEYQVGVIPLAAYTVVGRRDFSGLPERVLEMVDEKHFAVYYRDGEWWVEDLGSRHGTYLNGVRVKREKLREGDVISPGAAVAAVFKRCGTTRRVVPMEEEGTKTY